MRCFTAGYDLVDLEGSSEQYIHRKAIKALHVLFDVEVGRGFGSRNMSWLVLVGVVHVLCAVETRWTAAESMVAQYAGEYCSPSSQLQLRSTCTSHDAAIARLCAHSVL